MEKKTIKELLDSILCDVINMNDDFAEAAVDNDSYTRSGMLSLISEEQEYFTKVQKGINEIKRLIGNN